MERPWDIGSFSDIRVRRAVRALTCRRTYWRIKFRNWNSEHQNETQCVFGWNMSPFRMFLRLECLQIECASGWNMSPVRMFLRLECSSGCNVFPVWICLHFSEPQVGICFQFECTSGWNMSSVRMYLWLKYVSSSNVPPVGICLQFECTSGWNMSPVRMYLQLEYVSSSNVPPVGMCLQIECASDWNMSLVGTCFQFECFCGWNVFPVWICLHFSEPQVGICFQFECLRLQYVSISIVPPVRLNLPFECASGWNLIWSLFGFRFPPQSDFDVRIFETLVAAFHAFKRNGWGRGKHYTEPMWHPLTIQRHVMSQLPYYQRPLSSPHSLQSCMLSNGSSMPVSSPTNSTHNNYEPSSFSVTLNFTHLAQLIIILLSLAM
jgi:hypothetical protein